MTALAAIYWAGVLFALGFSISLAQKITEDNPVAGILFLILCGVIALLSWVAVRTLIGAVLVSIVSKLEG